MNKMDYTIVIDVGSDTTMLIRESEVYRTSFPDGNRIT